MKQYKAYLNEVCKNLFVQNKYKFIYFAQKDLKDL